MIGSQDLLVGLAIVLVLFGAKKLPELAASLGKSMKEFKKGVSEAGEEEPPRPAGPSIVTAAAPRPCPVCKTSLEPDRSHPWYRCCDHGTSSRHSVPAQVDQWAGRAASRRGLAQAARAESAPAEGGHGPGADACHLHAEGRRAGPAARGRGYGDAHHDRPCDLCRRSNP